MSKTKSKKKKTGTDKVKPSDVKEIPVDGDAEDEMSAGEKFLLASKPYWAHIALGVLACIFGSVLWTNYGNMTRESDALPWQELSNAMTQANLSNDVSILKEMASNYEGKAASHWALLLAGDEEVNRGIDMLARNRQGGLKMIGNGVESLQKVVDAPKSSKTPMVQRRSLYRLANAKEALGEFDAAKGHYQAILDDDDKCPWAPACKRGIARCSNEDMVAIYDKFRNWEEATAVAPGPLVPDAPKVDIEGIKLPEGEPDTFSGGEFGSDEMKKEEPAKTEAETETQAETTEAEPAVEAKKEEAVEETATPAAETETTVVPTTQVEMPAESAVETPAVEVPAVEVPAVEVPAETPAIPEVEPPAAPAAEVPSGEGG